MNQLTFGLVSNRNAAENQKVICQLYRYLQEKSINIHLDRHTAPILNAPESSLPELLKCDFICTLGGDGTILRIARSLGSSNPKIIGVNLGKLGFLTEVRPDHLFAAVDQVLAGDYSLDQRNLISVKIKRDNRLIEEYKALNEVAINQGLKARILRLELKTGQKLIHNFEVDGLIVSTPTGSTGHSLSAGGSIVSPDLDAFLITPICPLSLANRPLIIADHHKLKIKVKTKRDPESPVGLTIDGQVSFCLQQEDSIHIRKSAQTLKLVRVENYNFFRHLRSKLKWGN